MYVYKIKINYKNKYKNIKKEDKIPGLIFDASSPMSGKRSRRAEEMLLSW